MKNLLKKFIATIPVTLTHSNMGRLLLAKPAPKKIVHFSNGNSKTNTPSVDTLAGLFCNRQAACYLSGRCYACWLRDGAQQNYLDNSFVAVNDREFYFDEIERFISEKIIAKGKNAFRYHVSGEIVDTDYLDNMVKIAREFKKVIFWTYTKKYSLVNSYIANNGKLPKNLHILFSADENLVMNNPYNLPIFSQYYSGNENNAIAYAKAKGLKASFCCGDCKKCLDNKIGCPAAKKNTVIFCHIHGQRFNSYNRAVKIKGLAAITKTSKIYKEYSTSDKFLNGVLVF